MSSRSETLRIGRGGFTLIEVLATLVLVAVVLPVVVRAMGASAQIGTWSQRRATAAALAEAKLGELVVTGDWELGDDDGTFDPEVYGRHADRFAWALTSGEWNSTSFEQLTLTVTWTDGFHDRSLSLSTVVYVPSEDATSDAEASL